jgi:hypothetical protein
MNIPSFLFAGVLAAGFALTAGQARGAIVYSGVVNVEIPTDFDGVYIDLDGMAPSGSEFAGWDINPFFGGSVISTSVDFHPVADSVLSTATILRLDMDVEVGPSLTYAASPGGSSDHIGPAADQFTEGVESYIGFQFTLNDDSGPFFGWISITVTANNPGGVITGWAYDDEGQPIMTGAVPEPSSLLLLGLVPLLAWRRRRG